MAQVTKCHKTNTKVSLGLKKLQSETIWEPSRLRLTGISGFRSLLTSMKLLETLKKSLLETSHQRLVTPLLSFTTPARVDKLPNQAQKQ
jgi:hypothetical protein